MKLEIYALPLPVTVGAKLGKELYLTPGPCVAFERKKADFTSFLVSELHGSWVELDGAVSGVIVAGWAEKTRVHEKLSFVLV